MIELTSLIKPKRSSEDKKAYIFNDKIILHFNSVQVVCYGDTGINSSSVLSCSHKELFNSELENAIPVSLSYNIPDDIKWNELDVNTNDNVLFSAISGSGEDIFFIGNIQFTKDRRYGLNVYGLNYKVASRTYSDIVYNFNCDYEVFYYLFQLTKHLSGKKTDVILYGINDDKLYLTNKNKEYYVISDKNKALTYKESSVKQINLYYDTLKGNSPKQFFKKELNESILNTALSKTLLRPFNDVVNYIEYKDVNYIYDDKVKLWLMKKKS